MESAIYYVAVIIGAFVSIALAVNGYFIRSLLESLNQVKEQTAILIERSESKEQRLKQAEKDIRGLREMIHDIEKEMK